MHTGRGVSRAWIRATFSLDANPNRLISRPPPLFLCPAARPAVKPKVCFEGRTWKLAKQGKRAFASAATAVHEDFAAAAKPDSEGRTNQPISIQRRLPLQCPGCGAFSQTSDPKEPGYYDLSRQSTREYLGLTKPHKIRERPEDRIVREALGRLETEGVSSEVKDELGGLQNGIQKRNHQATDQGEIDSAQSIVCTRCHDLVHHNAGVPVLHPGIDAIYETIEESPHKYNHVYHVLDAADFPMSLLPRIHTLLDTMPLRTKNRRARDSKFYSGRCTELSFVVTRSDLLAPRKEQVDKLMPWIQDTLRAALGRTGRAVRLGNVRCVSAKRTWWTRELREEIWNRRGATWLVGKANVGKSYLVHHVFPKGRMNNNRNEKAELEAGEAKLLLGSSQDANAVQQLAETETETETETEIKIETEDAAQKELDHAEGSAYIGSSEHGDTVALLPPRQPETNYPTLPIVSSLSGTTVLPIRIPFGNGKGELIDLPGLPRSRLADYVQPQHQECLMMKSRIQPQQVVLNGPQHSLLLGGFLRITPRTPGLVFLAYNFTPLPEHRTATEKAVAIQEQASQLQVENIALPGAGDKTKLAGSFKLKYDVTKLRAGPITRKNAVNLPVERLPYRVLALDILIEGCGWVEIGAQERTKNLFEGRPDPAAPATLPEPNPYGILQSLDLSDPKEKEEKLEQAHDAYEPHWPTVDVFSPEGKFVSSRQPLNAWLLCQAKPSKKKERRTRPPKSMKGTKKMKRS